MSKSPAPNIAHFAINADDVNRARRFYERVFAWRFEPWGPPGFLQIFSGNEHEPGIRGALQKRRAELEAQIEDLKGRKASLPPDQYEAELERLVLELARVAQQIRTKS